MANKQIDTIKGFTAKKAGVEVMYKVEPYDIGYYIYIYINGKLDNVTTRNLVSKVYSFLAKERRRLTEIGGWEIEDSKPMKLKEIDPNKLKLR